MSKYFVFIIILLLRNVSFAAESISNLVTPVSYFVDHINQLQGIKENLNKYRKASVIGTSGIGKTQVVRTYAYDNITNYDIIWFLDCNLDINDEFIKLAKTLNALNKVGISEEKDLSKKEIIDYLSLRNNWLLVFDNLKINHNDKIKEFIDWDNNGNIIFSSQDGKELPNSVKMTTFNDKDASSLAVNLLNDRNEDDVSFLVNTFKGYPILIVQGAQLLNQVKGLNKEEYKIKIYQSVDKIKSNIESAIHELPSSSIKLLGKIALLNNQSFSKQLLTIISDNPNNVDDDIFQLSKFVLISCAEVDENNAVFEMHDIIAQKVLEINGDTKNQEYLEDIITKLTKALPATMHTGHIFRNAKTINDNLKIISNNHQKYQLNVNKLLPLYSSLLTNYINTLQYSEAEKILKWVQESESNNRFKLLLMSDEDKYFYSRILSNIGGYYKHRFADWNKALVFYLKADQALKGVKGYDAIKCNVFYNLANVYISLGRMEDAEHEINKMQKMFDIGIVDKEEIGMLHLIRAKYYYYQGNNGKALEESDKDIAETSKTGIKPDDLFFTVSYMLRIGILNTLGKYKEAYTQAEQLYSMHHPTKEGDHEIFGRIYTQMARSELGQGKIEEATKYINKAITILLANTQKNLHTGDVIEDPELALSYVVKGDILFAKMQAKLAIESYREAEKIYFNLYKSNRNKIAQVSYLYTQGAKAACSIKDLYYYKCFGEPQVKEFGQDHPNTIAMLKYCKQYDMNLWQKEP